MRFLVQGRVFTLARGGLSCDELSNILLVF
jgi:hypothetical protein